MTRAACLALLAAWPLPVHAVYLKLVLRSSASTHPRGTPEIIPKQLLLTGAVATLEELPPQTQRNVKQNIKMNADLHVKYLSNDDCQDYIKKHYDSELAAWHLHEKTGKWRGNVCRAAVLAREGGYYIASQLKKPLSALVSNTTTFLAAKDASPGKVNNCLIAAVSGSPVMEHVLAELRKWYQGATDDYWQGPVTMTRALHAYVREECPNEGQLDDTTFEWKCGPTELRLFEEKKLNCITGSKDECPPERKMHYYDSNFDGLHYGLFELARRGKQSVGLVSQIAMIGGVRPSDRSASSSALVNHQRC
eukprot:CAMPEP_0117504972 /NCGR_PEP_ID=MMETSP0784-20121206/25130_1 /TAXON_ID=39447 /ORGANISM="" /LENGTH=306 /DNA_ID=CAMNT_0005300355 /DNA_START=40 /DNA_END=962 /DNA_ORIENTATION=+